METPVVVTPQQVLVNALKAEGMDIAEDAVLTMAKAIFNAMPAFLLATETKWDDMLIPMLPVLLPFLIKEIDKIDGKVDASA